MHKSNKSRKLITLEGSFLYFGLELQAKNCFPKTPAEKQRICAVNTNLFENSFVCRTFNLEFLVQGHLHSEM